MLLLPLVVLLAPKSNVNVQDVVILFVIIAKLNGILIRHVMRLVLKDITKLFDHLRYLSVWSLLELLLHRLPPVMLPMLPAQAFIQKSKLAQDAKSWQSKCTMVHAIT
jgi:hypothetical protein